MQIYTEKIGNLLVHMAEINKSEDNVLTKTKN